jgi:hypothetical protein
MEFSEEKLFDVDATNEEIEKQLDLYLNSGGTGRGIVHMVMLNPIKGIAVHTKRILDILGEMDLPGLNDKKLL